MNDSTYSSMFTFSNGALQYVNATEMCNLNISKHQVYFQSPGMRVSFCKFATFYDFGI